MEAMWERGPWRVHVNRSDFASSASMALYRKHSDGTIDVAEPFIVKRYAAGEAPTWISTVGGDDGEQILRAFLNAAWEAGLRPDGYLDTRESMKAIDAHLQDMRRLVFEGHVEAHTTVDVARDPTAMSEAEQRNNAYQRGWDDHANGGHYRP